MKVEQCDGVHYHIDHATPSELVSVVSTTDLVEELKARGARQVGIGYDSAPEPYVWMEDVMPDDLEAGSYLVFSLEGEK